MLLNLGTSVIQHCNCKLDPSTGNLQGIVTEVGSILREPTLVSLVKQVGLWLFSYGVLK